jgi:hypothetical protein
MCPRLKMKSLHRRALVELVELYEKNEIMRSLVNSKLIPRFTKHTDREELVVTLNPRQVYSTGTSP